MKKYKFTIMIVVVAIVTGLSVLIVDLSSGDSSVNSPTITDESVFDSTYDDRWVSQLPSSIQSHSVLHVSTPANTACNEHPVITLVEPSDLESGDPEYTESSIIVEIRSFEFVPSNILITFVPDSVDKEMIETKVEEWNSAMIDGGCKAIGVG